MSGIAANVSSPVEGTRQPSSDQITGTDKIKMHTHETISTEDLMQSVLSVTSSRYGAPFTCMMKTHRSVALGTRAIEAGCLCYLVGSLHRRCHRQ